MGKMGNLKVKDFGDVTSIAAKNKKYIFLAVLLQFLFRQRGFIITNDMYIEMLKHIMKLFYFFLFRPSCCFLGVGAVRMVM